MRSLTRVRQSRIQRTVLIFGVWFTLGNYLAGTLTWPSTIADPDAMHTAHVLGIIPVMVNGWHLYFHLLTGIVCLALSGTRPHAITAGLFVGGIYVLVGAAGFLSSANIFGLIMADSFANWVHLIEGALLLAAGASGELSTRRGGATSAQS